MIKICKLISGEELIGELVDQNSSQIEIKNPAVVVMQQTQTGVGIGLMPFMPYSEGNVNLMHSAISAMAEPTQKLINEYNRIFGSGIEVAPASALAGLQIAS